MNSAKLEMKLVAPSGYECESTYNAVTPEQWGDVVGVLEGKLSSASPVEPADQSDVYAEGIAAGRRLESALSNQPANEDELREVFEAMANDSLGFKRSRRGTYQNPPIARDWKWFLAGASLAPAAQPSQAKMDALQAKLAAMEAKEPMTWESTTEAYIKYVSQSRYEKFSPQVQRWYKPIPTAAGTSQQPFQERVLPWLHACFGEVIAADKTERNHRFLEESMELVQACGCTQSEAHQLVDYVFGRPVGEPSQEVGGVMVTLAALCLAQRLDMHQCGETELTRIWTKLEPIRAKQAAKPKHSPLPMAQPTHAAAKARELSDEEILRHWARRDKCLHGRNAVIWFARATIRAAINAKGAAS